MTKPKPLGQIAYQKYWHGYTVRGYQCQSTYMKKLWNSVGDAVTREVKRRGEKKK